MNNITLWENKKRRNALIRYKNTLEKYFDLIDYNEFNREIIDNDTLRSLREYLNRENIYIEKVLRESGLSVVVRHTPPPMIGGYIQNINLLDNMFQLQNYDIEITSITDIIEQAIGAYQRGYWSSVFRTLNPFFWIGRVIDIFSTIPFYIFAGMGYDQHKLEKSSWGIALKGFLKTIGFLFTFAATIDGVWSLLAALKIIPSELNLPNLIHKYLKEIVPTVYNHRYLYMLSLYNN